jgi:predicted GIY-YIG superfamily endonuclease
MTETAWTPAIETGLSGDAYLSEQAEAFVDSQLQELHAPGVYALKLSQPDDPGVVRDRWARVYEVDVPGWVWSAFEARGVLYVGGAENVYERITEHLESPNRSASICHVFPIHSLWDVWLFDDATRAFEREGGIALRLKNAYPELYVRQA